MAAEHRKSLSTRDDLVKVDVVLVPVDWHTHGIETLWAQPVGDERYRLENVPFYAYGLSYHDVVHADRVAGSLRLQQVVARSGHSTYRIFLNNGIRVSDQRFGSAWRPLEMERATYECADARLLAVDIPAPTDIYVAYGLLQAGENAGVWDFEEGHVGHTLTQ